jgi:hypothetical protein
MMTTRSKTYSAKQQSAPERRAATGSLVFSTPPSKKPLSEPPAIERRVLRSTARPVVPKLTFTPDMADDVVKNTSPTWRIINDTPKKDRYIRERQEIRDANQLGIVGRKNYEGPQLETMMFFTDIRLAILYGELMTQMGQLQLREFNTRVKENAMLQKNLLGMFPEPLRESLQEVLFNYFESRIDLYDLFVLRKDGTKFLIDSESFLQELVREFNIPVIVI